tara:strand:+ start:74 stop:199 length:126 start_codon:yes stop_codon:yes gene_type:complete
MTKANPAAGLRPIKEASIMASLEMKPAVPIDVKGIPKPVSA